MFTRQRLTHIVIFSILVAANLLASSPYAYAQTSSSKAPSENKQVRYISDELFIFLHAGPGRDFRMLGSITAGTTVNLLQVDKEAGYAQIQDERDRIGWVESKFVSRIPSIRAEIDMAKERVKEQQREVDEAVAKMREAENKLAVSQEQKQRLNRQLTKTLEQKAELQRSFEKRSSKEQMQWFTRGSILALMSVLFGFLLGFFARKRNKANPLL
ncbi:TIGR04211 family SH3 domain-containing protein [Glaciecola sp. MH2013]|uniref:TIGR04211 family SH3 domain-containing protein n=1 Tax=Glaciecola sp. MH2013 TaxID=2785524 RepID=UPI0018A027BD|nr:TIGR04211 family SH3 domain-containing protein [Glaciecola sp. MH2013]MBF7071857.1 TIGR04211 family SH3 domain-containing protein [Glaciecola sp. MH2013]